MDANKEQQIWRVVREEAGRITTEGSPIEFDDLVGYGWQRILECLRNGEQNNEGRLHRWARQGMLRALENEKRVPQPIGLAGQDF